MTRIAKIRIACYLLIFMAVCTIALVGYCLVNLDVVIGLQITLSVIALSLGKIMCLMYIHHQVTQMTYIEWHTEAKRISLKKIKKTKEVKPTVEKKKARSYV